MNDILGVLLTGKTVQELPDHNVNVFPIRRDGEQTYYQAHLTSTVDIRIRHVMRVGFTEAEAVSEVKREALLCLNLTSVESATEEWRRWEEMQDRVSRHLFGLPMTPSKLRKLGV